MCLSLCELQVDKPEYKQTAGLSIYVFLYTVTAMSHQGGGGDYVME
jgi:hypothetical protein